MAAAAPRFPLSGRAPSPQLGRVRATGSFEIFEPAQPLGCALERLPAGAKCREVQLSQMGSGVWVVPGREASAAKRAESDRQAVGQGAVRAHEPLDVGETMMLRSFGVAVNGFVA